MTVSNVIFPRTQKLHCPFCNCQDYDDKNTVFSCGFAGYYNNDYTAAIHNHCSIYGEYLAALYKGLPFYEKYTRVGTSFVDFPKTQGMGCCLFCGEKSLKGFSFACGFKGKDGKIESCCNNYKKWITIAMAFSKPMQESKEGLETKIKHLEHKLASTEKAYSGMLDAYNAQTKNYREDKKKIKELENKLETERANQKSKNESLETENQKLNAMLDAQSEEIKRLDNKLKTYEDDKKIQDTKEQDYNLICMENRLGRSAHENRVKAVIEPYKKDFETKNTYDFEKLKSEIIGIEKKYDRRRKIAFALVTIFIIDFLRAPLSHIAASFDPHSFFSSWQSLLGYWNINLGYAQPENHGFSHEWGALGFLSLSAILLSLFIAFIVLINKTFEWAKVK